MEQDAPRPPPVYELIVLDRVDSVIEEAARRADGGAGEGTLLWARAQDDATTRRGKRWESPEGNLHCALIIQPDYDNVTAEQLLYVAAISAGTAIADVLEPMTGLRYRWPNHIFINDLKSGALQFRAPATSAERYPWVAIGLNLNVAHHPPNPEPERFNSIHASGTPTAQLAELLEIYSRHFLAWINRWADEGFAPVRKTWVQRADGLNEQVVVRLSDEEITGVLREPDNEGRGVIEMPDGSFRSIGIGEYFFSGRRSA